MQIKNITFFILFLSSVACCHADSRTNFIPIVAHAGGGYKNETYTNSINALEANATNFDLFEIDFNFTSDRKLVCIHNWVEAPVIHFNTKLNDAPSYSEFLKLATTNPKYTNCTLDSLIKWLKKYSSKKIVTDIKVDNIDGLAYIKDKYPDYLNRFIPQIYNPTEYLKVKQIGFDEIILTLYAWDADDDQVINYLSATDHIYYAITMWNHRAPKLAPRIKTLGIPVYAHTVNDIREYKKLLNNGVTSIYSDWITKNLGH